MKKKMFCLIGAVLSVIMFATACGESRINGDNVNLTVYMARATGMVDGTRDSEVGQAIEEKFYEDTGIKINLDVKLYSDNELKTQVDNNWTKKSNDMDAVIHYVGEDSGSAIKSYAAETETVYEVGDLLEQYGQNILKYIRQGDTYHVSEMSSYMCMEDGSYQMNVIPSVNAEQGYAILVRKDFMEQVKSVTGLDPEDYDVLNDNYQNMSMSDFVNLVNAMDGNIKGIRYAISGTAWDMNRVIGPAYDVDAYNIQLDESGNYVPAQFTSGAGDFMDQLWNWAKNGVWEPDSANMTDSTRLTYFLSGYSGVYITYPEISNIINVARKLNTYNSNAEYMVIAPLADKDGNVNGFQKIQRSFNGVIIPLKSTDSVTLVKFIDWMYSDTDNYELCKYGVKGTDWVEGEDKIVNGVTYNTWSYPDSKVEEYNNNPPYSGKFCILQNINVSNRIRGDYSLNEMQWYEKAISDFPVYVSTSPEGVSLQEVPKEYKTQSNYIDGDYVNNIRGITWAGKGTTAPSDLLASYISEHKTTCAGYLSWLDTNIKTSISYFDTKFQD